jgi:hypothetical protein
MLMTFVLVSKINPLSIGPVAAVQSLQSQRSDGRDSVAYMLRPPDPALFFNLINFWPALPD